MEIDPFCQSSQEISALWKYLYERLQRADGGYGTQEDGGEMNRPQNRVFGRRAV